MLARLERWEGLDLALEGMQLRRPLIGQSRVCLGFLRGLVEATAGNVSSQSRTASFPDGVR